jgi:signal transduction histidine kinase
MTLKEWFDADRFMPHGHCFQWDPAILWSSVTADVLIALAYTAIPFTLVFQIMRKRKDLPFNWMFVCFGLFIVACGMTHVMDVITIWRPHYGISAMVKVLTALASVPTAIILFKIAPKIVRFPSFSQLMDEQALRMRAESESQAKDRLLASISHELRTPLTPVVMTTEILRRDETLPEPVKRALDVIAHNVQLESKLVDDLLDFARVSTGKLSVELAECDVHEVLERAVRVCFGPNITDGQKVVTKLNAPRHKILGDATRLQQVFWNLLQNANKFSSPGNSITISSRTENERLCVDITDVGCGIEPSMLERIFEPFTGDDHTAAGKGGRQGLGLGLSIARHIVLAHGGTLVAASDGANRGATFTVSLPTHDAITHHSLALDQRIKIEAQLSPANRQIQTSSS